MLDWFSLFMGLRTKFNPQNSQNKPSIIIICNADFFSSVTEEIILTPTLFPQHTAEVRQHILILKRLDSEKIKV